MLGQHFASAERAVQMSEDDLCTEAISEPQGPLRAVGYGALTAQKAPGLTGLPSELYLADPVGAADAHHAWAVARGPRRPNP